VQVLTTTASMSRGSSGPRPAPSRRPRTRARRVGEKAPVERVGVDAEDLVERIEREVARLDAVVALQDQARDHVRARVEAREPGGALEGFEALRPWCSGVEEWRCRVREQNIVATMKAMLRSIANSLLLLSPQVAQG
jgi:hypothetical protein